jgi:hypothetical protein
MSWRAVIRDVEAGGSNPLTPTTKPLVTGLRQRSGSGVRSFSGTLGAKVSGGYRDLTVGRVPGIDRCSSRAGWDTSGPPRVGRIKVS